MNTTQRIACMLTLSAAAFLSLTDSVQAQRPVIVQDTDEPARAPYQKSVFLNQGSGTCATFYCLLPFDQVPAGKRLVITYASALFGASGAATISVNVDPHVFATSILLPLPASYGGSTWVGGSPVTFYVDAGHTPAVIIGGAGVQNVSISARATIVGYYVSVP